MFPVSHKLEFLVPCVVTDLGGMDFGTCHLLGRFMTKEMGVDPAFFHATDFCF